MPTNRTKEELILLQAIESYLERISLEAEEDDEIDADLLDRIQNFIKSLYDKQSSDESIEFDGSLNVVFKWSDDKRIGHLYKLPVYEHESIHIVNDLISKVLGREMKYLGSVKINMQAND